MLSVKWRRIRSVGILLIFLLTASGCGLLGSDTWTVWGIVQTEDPGEARLLLELKAGTGEDQPGWAPERVGGVSARVRPAWVLTWW